MRIVTVILFVLCSISVSAKTWKLEKDKNDIQVYTRSVKGSNVKEFKVTSNINASRMEIAKIVTKASDYMNWIPNVEASRVLKVVSPTKRIVYYEVDCPWPTSNRDIVMDMWVETNDEKETTWVKFKENLTAKKEVDGLVRMEKTEGFWKLRSITSKRTEVNYQFLGDPGGSLPSWLINMFIVDTPYDMFIALKEKVES